MFCWENFGMVQC